MVSVLLNFLFFIFVSLIFILNNPVISVLLLVLIFCLTACICLFLGLEVLSLMIMVVYVGAIAVLFLFVVMLLNVRYVELNINLMFWFLYFFGLFSLFILGVLFYCMFFLFNEVYVVPFFMDYYIGSEPLINMTLFSEFLFVTNAHFLIVSSLILFVGMVGCISISFTKINLEYSSFMVKQNLLNQRKRRLYS